MDIGHANCKNLINQTSTQYLYQLIIKKIIRGNQSWEKTGKSLLKILNPDAGAFRIY